MDARELAKYVQNVDESEITDTARVECIFDEEGIWIDMVYSGEGIIDNYQTCFAELYSDDEGNPNEEMWIFAKEAAKEIASLYQLPVAFFDNRRTREYGEKRNG